MPSKIQKTDYIYKLVTSGRENDVVMVLKRVSRVPPDTIRDIIHQGGNDWTICKKLQRFAPTELVHEQRPTRRNELLLWLTRGVNRYQSYLDIGCGDMTLTSAVKTGFVVPDGVVGACDIQVPRHVPAGIEFRKNTDRTIPFPDSTFEFVTMFHAMHHFEFLDDMLQELSRVTTPTATLVIREHDCDASHGCYLLISLMHIAYDIIHHNIQPHMPIHMSRTRKSWTALLDKNGWVPGRIAPSNSIDRLYTQTFYKK